MIMDIFTLSYNLIFFLGQHICNDFLPSIFLHGQTELNPSKVWMRTVPHMIGDAMVASNLVVEVLQSIRLIT